MSVTKATPAVPLWGDWSCPCVRFARRFKSGRKHFEGGILGYVEGDSPRLPSIWMAGLAAYWSNREGSSKRNRRQLLALVSPSLFPVLDGGLGRVLESPGEPEPRPSERTYPAGVCLERRRVRTDGWLGTVHFIAQGAEPLGTSTSPLSAVTGDERIGGRRGGLCPLRSGTFYA